MKGLCTQVNISQVAGEPPAKGEEPNLTLLIPVRHQVTGQVEPSASLCFSWFVAYKEISRDTSITFLKYAVLMTRMFQPSLWTDLLIQRN